MSSIYDWSLQAADNANADDSINWAEGQPPGSVNNSARAMMQRIKQFLADIGGVITAGGTANTVTVTSNSPIRSYADGIIIRFRAVAANSAKAGLSLNNLAAKPVLKAGLHAAVPLEGGEMQPGGIYECVYNTGLGNNGAWFLVAPVFMPPAPPAAPAIPAGIVAPFCGAGAPAGWLKCNGAWQPRKDYPALYKAIGDCFGADEKGVNFRLPDLRGEFIRGWADDRSDMALQKGRLFGSRERGMVESHRHRGATDWGGGHAHQMPFGAASADGGGYRRGISEGWKQWTDEQGSHNHSFTTDWGVNDDNRLGAETRPQNMALLYCIKY